MGALVAICVGGFALFLCVAIVCGIWRVNMAINHPEKYERFRKWEKEYAEEQRESLRKAAEGAGKVAGFALKVGSTFLKK